MAAPNRTKGLPAGTVIVLNELKMLSVALRVFLTFALSIVFLITGANKASPDLHKPMHDFYLSIFPDACQAPPSPRACSSAFILSGKPLTLCCRFSAAPQCPRSKP